MTRIFIIILVIALLSGCSGGITNVAVEDYDTLIQSGWEQYNNNLFSEANQLFLKAKEADSTKPES